VTADAYDAIRQRLLLHKPLPVTPDWSAAPDFVDCIIDHCLAQRPLNILECSSGLTTLALARCCQMNNHGHVYSLESGAEYIEMTRTALEAFRLNQFASVIHAPLETVTLNGEPYRWYRLRAVPDTAFDMLVIDGPSGTLHRHSRYPTLPLLKSRLAGDCIVFLDDAARDDEKTIVRMWLDALPQISHEYLNLARGCSILRIGH
jgi:hypothetical protein